jgi:hypothetical protein
VPLMENSVFQVRKDKTTGICVLFRTPLVVIDYVQARHRNAWKRGSIPPDDQDFVCCKPDSIKQTFGLYYSP